MGGNVGLGTDLGRSRRELALGACVQIGDRAVTLARGKKEDKGGREKGGLAPFFFGKRRREWRRRGRGRREALPPSLGGLRAERRGRGDDDSDDGWAVWSGAMTRATGAAGADDGGDQAVGHHGTRARLATGGAADLSGAAWARTLACGAGRLRGCRAAGQRGRTARTAQTARLSRMRARRAGRAEGGALGVALAHARAARGQSGGEGGERESAPGGRGRGRWAERDSAHRTLGWQNRLLRRNLIWKDWIRN
ncbi:Epstein-Barr virus EBNA-1-like protein [Oryza sativa Japonica Group]|uniref:Epstein-Barr virus EBNA-1-like protein n=1 Tax=Oryza sativa subsp. japonica TaxID=39947 RepID=Q5VQV6_ORYSJ|nr:Epstein-Barr virus EBNA-1-like protein [Oryza sativa Japonica Group]